MPLDRTTRGLIFAHFLVAFAAFLVAAILGVYQVLERAEIIPALISAEGYYESVSIHGNLMAYVLTTFFILGFGYAVAPASLRQPIWRPGLAWLGFAAMMVGLVLVAGSLVTGNATVLYTFYPPMIAHWTYYVGSALVLLGSLPWVVIMIVMMVRWKRRNPGERVPLVMYATTANAILWAWTLVGVGTEVVFQLIPLSLGWVEGIDVGLARTLFVWTLHPIVYFWLLPAYTALYSLLPPAAGARLYSEIMGRIVFILLLVFSLPVGIHHLFVDPFQAAGWKLFHAFNTAIVAIPSLLTGFTILATLEESGRRRGGRGLFGWIPRLSWGEPMVAAAVGALLMLILGGFGGVVNSAYAMNTVVHNTMWVTAHFHLIFGGTSVIMYFAIAYLLWPKALGRVLHSTRLAVIQIVLWFVGMVVLTTPWHMLGLLGEPRRTAFAGYAETFAGQWEPYELTMTVGGAVLLVSSLAFVWNLVATAVGRRAPDAATPHLTFSTARDHEEPIPTMLNGFTLWNWIIALLMLVAFGYPILQFFLIETYPMVPFKW